MAPQQAAGAAKKGLFSGEHALRLLLTDKEHLSVPLCVLGQSHDRLHNAYAVSFSARRALPALHSLHSFEASKKELNADLSVF